MAMEQDEILFQFRSFFHFKLVPTGIWMDGRYLFYEEEHVSFSAATILIFVLLPPRDLW